jgi:H+-transporting ATPase
VKTTPMPTQVQDSEVGLSTAEATERLNRYGPNEVPEEREHWWVTLGSRFWAPVPWMLEAAIVLTVVLGRQADAIIISFLLIFNAVVSLVQQNRAENALVVLRKHLAVNARVRRDGEWRLVPAREIVVGDIVHLRVGDIVPADIHLLSGSLLVDQSALTGESVPLEAAADSKVYSASVIERGEATGEVTAAGVSTFFGKTAQLVQTAKTVTHLESVILRIVRYLVVIDAILVAAILVYAWSTGIPLSEALPFALVLLIASVPAALPATFTIAQALGSLELSRQGVLITRLSAVEEAASMDVLCIDKTGTVTENRLSVAEVRAYAPFDTRQVLGFGALTSDASSQDPIDLAILQAPESQPTQSGYTRLSFAPFDPSTKRTEAQVQKDGAAMSLVKGMPQIVAALAGNKPEEFASDLEALSARGYRVLAVAAGAGKSLEIAGLIGLADQVRPDSAALIGQLRDLGISIKMITGDGAATARAIASQIGITGRACTAADLKDASPASVEECDIYAGVFPEDKYTLVKSLQAAGHVVGMTGDGVNDAPALKQAEVGIAVSSATDVAKSAASIVLTDPGLLNIVSAVQSSRRIYQRMLTYTLNKIIKTIQISILLAVVFLLARYFVVTPFLVILLLFANDFVTMSIATDNVSYSLRPDRWHLRDLVESAGLLAGMMLIESFLVLYLATDVFRLPQSQIQTLVFVMLVFSGQATVYLVRQRHHFWDSRPSRWLASASVADIVAVSILASQGLLMAAVPLPLVLAVIGIAICFVFLIEPLKIAAFRWFGIS